jgi:hypothetical protein
VVPRDDGKNRPKEQGERKGEEAPGENGSAKRAGKKPPKRENAGKAQAISLRTDLMN